MKRAVIVGGVCGALIAAAVGVTVLLPAIRPTPEPPVPSELASSSAEFSAMANKAIDDVRAMPSNHERWLTLGMVYEANQFMEPARTCYETSAQLGGGARATYHLAVLRGRLGDVAGAVEAMRKTIDVDPSHGPAHWRLGFWLLDLNELDQAESAFLEAMSRRMGPYDLAGEIGLARVAIMRGQLDRAVAVLTTLTNRPSPYVSYANHLLGTALARLGEREEAQRALSRGRAAEPVFPDALHEQLNAYRLDTDWKVSRAKTLVARGEYSSAIAILEQAAHDKPGDLLVTNNLAIAMCGAGRMTESIALLDRVLDDRPGSYQGHFNMALALRARATLVDEAEQAELREQALAHLDEALRLNPTFDGALGMRADMLREDGRFDEALENCFQALATEPASEMWWRQAAMIALDAHDFDRAQSCAQQLGTLRPGDPQVATLLRDITARRASTSSEEQMPLRTFTKDSDDE